MGRARAPARQDSHRDPGCPMKSGQRAVQAEEHLQEERLAGNLPRHRLGRPERLAPVSALSLRPLTPDPCPRAKIAHSSDSYMHRPGIPHRAPALHSAAQPAAAAANIPTTEPLQPPPPPPPHRCHSGSCASPRIRRLLSLSPTRPAPRPHATAHWL